MASYHAIAAISSAILGLLQSACPKPEFDDAQFELYQSNDFQNPMAEGISLYLYRIAFQPLAPAWPTRLFPQPPW